MTSDSSDEEEELLGPVTQILLHSDTGDVAFADLYFALATHKQLKKRNFNCVGHQFCHRAQRLDLPTSEAVKILEVGTVTLPSHAGGVVTFRNASEDEPRSIPSIKSFKNACKETDISREFCATVVLVPNNSKLDKLEMTSDQLARSAALHGATDLLAATIGTDNVVRLLFDSEESGELLRQHVRERGCFHVGEYTYAIVGAEKEQVVKAPVVGAPLPLFLPGRLDIRPGDAIIPTLQKLKFSKVGTCKFGTVTYETWVVDTFVKNHRRLRNKRGKLVEAQWKHVPIVENPAAKALLRSVPGPLCVISAFGGQRQGKSSLMRFLSEKLSDGASGGGFRVSSALHSCTQGAWISSSAVKISDNEGRSWNVLIIDTEGCDQAGGPNLHSTAFWSRLAGTVTMLSSIVLLNQVCPTGISKSFFTMAKDIYGAMLEGLGADVMSCLSGASLVLVARDLTQKQFQAAGYKNGQMWYDEIKKEWRDSLKDVLDFFSLQKFIALPKAPSLTCTSPITFAETSEEFQKVWPRFEKRIRSVLRPPVLFGSNCEGDDPKFMSGELLVQEWRQLKFLLSGDLATNKTTKLAAGSTKSTEPSIGENVKQMISETRQKLKKDNQTEVACEQLEALAVSPATSLAHTMQKMEKVRERAPVPLQSQACVNKNLAVETYAAQVWKAGARAIVPGGVEAWLRQCCADAGDLSREVSAQLYAALLVLVDEERARIIAVAEQRAQQHCERSLRHSERLEQVVGRLSDGHAELLSRHSDNLLVEKSTTFLPAFWNMQEFGNLLIETYKRLGQDEICERQHRAYSRLLSQLLNEVALRLVGVSFPKFLKVEKAHHGYRLGSQVANSFCGWLSDQSDVPKPHAMLVFDRIGEQMSSELYVAALQFPDKQSSNPLFHSLIAAQLHESWTTDLRQIRVAVLGVCTTQSGVRSMVVRMERDPPSVASEHALTNEDKIEIQSQLQSLDEAKVDVAKADDFDQPEKQQILATLEDDNATLRSVLTAAFTHIRQVFRRVNLPDPLHIKNTHRFCYRVIYDSPEAAEPLQNLQDKQRRKLGRNNLRLQYSDSLWSLGAVLRCGQKPSDLESLRSLVRDSSDLELVDYSKPDPMVCCVVVRLLADAATINVALQPHNVMVLTCSELLCELNEEQMVNFEKQVKLSDLLYYTRDPCCRAAVLPDDMVRTRLGFKKLEIPDSALQDLEMDVSDSDYDPNVTDFSQSQQVVPELTQWVPRKAYERCERLGLSWADFTDHWLSWDWKPRDFLGVWNRAKRAAEHKGTPGQYHQPSRQLLTLVGMVTRAAIVRGSYMPSDKNSHNYNELQKNEMKVPEVATMKVLVLDRNNLMTIAGPHRPQTIKIPKPHGIKMKSRTIEFVRLRDMRALIKALREVRAKDKKQPYSSGVFAVVLHHTDVDPQELKRTTADWTKLLGIQFVCVERQDAIALGCHWAGQGSLASPAFKKIIEPIRDARLEAMAVVGDETERYKLFGRDRKYLVNIPAITAPIELVDMADISLVSAEQDPRGTVRVVNADCLDVAETLAQLGKTEGQKFVPIVLNMANAFHAGGGFERGATAQEEDLCRRTNFWSCFGNAGADSKFYPIKNPLPNMFSSRVVRGVSVIRNRAGLGYSFRHRPFQVDLLCAACFQDGKFTKSAHGEGNEKVCNPPVRGGPPHLRTEVMALTRRKFEVMLSAAATLSKINGGQPLVLCAIGTGAFKNPSADIAAILGEVVPWFARYFTEMTFAIIGSPQGRTYRTFCQEFQHVRIPPKLGNKMYFALPPCEYGALCYKLDDSVHTGATSHPPWCNEHMNCARINDPVHSVLARHKQMCSQKAQCQRVGERVHRECYSHPEACGANPNCLNNDPEHRRDTWHPPECKHGPVCAKLKNPKVHAAHLKKFSHIRKPCKEGARCQQVFVDSEHVQQVTHPFADPCNTLAYCNDDSISHLASCSHACPHGEQCSHLQNPKTPSAEAHFETFVHVLNRRCAKYSNCKNFGEWHLSTFSHEGVKDFRPCCNAGDFCHKQIDEDHVKKYAHPPPPLPPVDVKRRTWVSQYDGAGGSAPVVLDDTADSTRVSFHHNTSQFEKKAVAFLKEAEPSFDPFSAKVLAIAEKMRGWHVGHRCNRDKLESMLQLSQVVSLETMSVLSNDQKLLEQVAKQREPLYSFFLSLNSGANELSHCDNWLSAVISFESISFKKDTHDPSAGGAPPPADGEIKRVQHKIWEAVPALSSTFAAAKARKGFAKYLRKMDFATFEADATACIKTVVTTGLKLGGMASKGVQYHVDQKIGTHRTVFGVLGPHMYKTYGTITLILKPEILEHPDSYLFPQCATAYHSGAYKARGRPWSWPEALKWPESKEHFEADKLHPCVRAPDGKHTYPDLFRALALDFIARVHHEQKKLPSSITYKDIQKLQTTWSATATGNHNLCETHLPKEFNMRYVKDMVMTNAVHKLLQKSSLQLIKDYGINLRVMPDDAAALKESERLGWEGGISRPAGMAIGLAPGKPAMSGLKRVRNKPFCVYWCATRGDFELTLSSKNELKQVAKSANNIRVTFRYDAFTHQTEVTVTYRLTQAKTRVRCMLHPSAGIGWGVEAHLGGKPYVVVRFWGPSEFATTPVKVLLENAAGANLRDIQYFGFSNIGSIALAIRYLHLTMSPMAPAKYHATSKQSMLSWFASKLPGTTQPKHHNISSHHTPQYSQTPGVMCDLCGEIGHATAKHRCKSCKRSGRHVTSRCPGTCSRCSAVGMHREQLCPSGEAPGCKICPRKAKHTTEQHRCNACGELGDHAMQHCPQRANTGSAPPVHGFASPPSSAERPVSPRRFGSPPQTFGNQVPRYQSPGYHSPQSQFGNQSGYQSPGSQSPGYHGYQSSQSPFASDNKPQSHQSPFNFPQSTNHKQSAFATDHISGGGGGGGGGKQHAGNRCTFCGGNHASEEHYCTICEQSGVHRARDCPKNWSASKKK